ncbi:hypothetical protein JCM9534A_42610 [Catenuloplanes indicus JCM 9534]|uniref:Uncharacterized protein n=1 Tax=Catenuloplanes indicus TaxID=137267 RepID=A0AAE3W1I0_9ACTN|nr:hypothetical protein [Catenuloplanes indicus]
MIGALTSVFSLMAVNLGGFFVGLVLGTVGSALAFGWASPSPSPSPSPEREPEPVEEPDQEPSPGYDESPVLRPAAMPEDPPERRTPGYRSGS